MAKIRQEINISNSTYTHSGDNPSTVQPLGKVQIDTNQYNGTVTYYFEVVATNTSASFTSGIKLKNGAGTEVLEIDVPVSTSTPTRFRSVSFTPTSGTDTYNVVWSTGILSGNVIKAARIIIIQDTSTQSLMNTETQIEIGMHKTGLTSTATTKVVPDTTLTKYWKYTAANWDGTKTFYAEVTYSMASSKSSGTFVLQEDNGSFASWTDTITIVNAGIASTATRVRSVAFTPTDGRNYRIAYLVASSKSAASIYNAKIIVEQTSTVADSYVNGIRDSAGAVYGATGSNEAQGMSFTTTSAYSTQQAALLLYKLGSPTDNINVELVSGSINGTVLATSSNLSSTVVGVGEANERFIVFQFPSVQSLSNATVYYLRLNRTGARDTTNTVIWTGCSTANEYTSGGSFVRDSGVWAAENSTRDREFKILNDASPVTELEPQYLLLNTSDAGGTINQDYDTLWDSTEWSSVTNVYKHAMDSDNASNSADLVDIDNSDTQVTNSSVTGANQQISSALTMPTTGHQIDTDIDNTTGTIAASRILVATTVITTPSIPNKIRQINQSINRSGSF